MTDDQHGDRHAEGAPRSGGRWDPLPQGDYDDGATAFVQLPEGGIDALLSSADSPLAAPGHGYVPPQITVTPATTAGTDPAATGTWSVPGAPVDGAQWNDPHTGQPGAAQSGQGAYGYEPGATGQWTFEDANAAEHSEGAAPGHDVTGQWSIPVADGDLPDESGEFTTSALVEQWGGSPPATLPGGAPAPWATTQSIGRPWGPGVPGVPQDDTDAPGDREQDTGPARAEAAQQQTDDRRPPAGPGADGHAPADGPSQQGDTGHAHDGSDRGVYAHGAPGEGGSPHERASHEPDAGLRSSHEGRPYAAEPYPASPGDPHWRPEAYPEPGAEGGAPGETREHPQDPVRGDSGPAEPSASPEATHAPGRADEDASEPEEHAADGARTAPDAQAGPDRADEGRTGPAPSPSGAAQPMHTSAAEHAADGSGAPDSGRTPAEAAPGAPADADGEPRAAEATGTDGEPAAPAPEDSAPPQGPPPGAPHDDHPLASYVLRVNGTDRPVSDAWIGESLLYVLRERLGLAGAKDGCSQGECGACNVQVDGRLVASCLVPAVTAAGSEVRTVEGLAQDGQPSDVQRALARCGAVQCGFCVPGMAMTVHDLLEGNPAPTELETRQALCGNLCRCSGYRGVVDAVKEVVAEREAHSASPEPDLEPDEARIPHQAGPGAGGVNPSAFQPPHDQPYGQDGGQA
ncbi:2Fe-2S iron-sulfur cluster-binding protein [Streptomyces sp. NPDC052013]|uniref:2Fe-2S iron-sulfur cluster-binding protein n=1 Tax=Streptomyces sp. NPDC052013 TaxID=3365679 RepID=UPI0037D37A11